MASAQRLMKEIEGIFKDAKLDHPYLESYWNDLKDKVSEAMPELTAVGIGGVFRMNTKRGEVRAVCTKSNPKTWVMYETTDSLNPGMRWMIGKTWCCKDNIWRDEAQSYTLPEGVVVK